MYDSDDRLRGMLGVDISILHIDVFGVIELLESEETFSDRIWRKEFGIPS